MICSISTSKSGTNWLDRLRSSKGFPSENDADLEHFLNRNPNSCSDSIPRKSQQEPIAESNEHQIIDLEKQRHRSKDDPENRTKREDWFDIMSSALAELFVMGGDSRKLGRETRSSRKKHQNPKLCVISASATASVDDFSLNGAKREGDGVAALSPSSADNSVAGAKTKKRHGSIDQDRFEADRYSRADVTIIDTSAPIWRSDKVIFRKGSVWKVRDKNSKCRKISSLRKKRKASQFDEEVMGGKKEKKKRKKKKQKVSSSLPHPCPGDSKEIRVPEERIISFVEGFPKVERKPSSKQISETPCQVPMKRHVFSRSPRKPAKRDSFHIQGVPSSAKVWGSPSKKPSIC